MLIKPSPYTLQSLRGSFFQKSIRFQSSVTFLNNKTLTQQKKQAKQKGKHTQYHTNTNVKVKSIAKASDTTDTKVPIHIQRKKKRFDYSTLPKVEPITNLRHNEISTDILYSGYRPLFLNFKDLENSSRKAEFGNSNNSTLYEIAMKLDDLSPEAISGSTSSNFWHSTSATGMEVFDEWDNVPNSILKNLKPFQAPVKKNLTHKETIISLKKGITGSSRAETFLKKVSNILNNKRRKGRKRPIVSLLQLRKKMREDED
ncbi:hypothetical protein NCAS_0C01310 [Naumovozyma castellii]|uniref:Uncharacterized protein n=1 Tax=Naumovozyma castellii TaxID=27288 RepID=G0VCB2_NAUCA|nr:hypothetical protein NCAS_0C01310 [Naumovozyma castellii CBS 4309]CCC69121.1 hypothetical protein NCAS_0C01310 [Naumovozyma castellii CBS 4309]